MLDDVDKVPEERDDDVLPEMRDAIALGELNDVPVESGANATVRELGIQQLIFFLLRVMSGPSLPGSRCSLPGLTNP